MPNHAQTLWEQFWLAPSEATLRPFLGLPDARIRAAISADLWEGGLGNGIPRPCWRAAALLSFADPRPEHRRESRSRWGPEEALKTLGDLSDPSRDAQAPARRALGLSLTLWDRFTAAGLLLSVPEARGTLEDAWAPDLWLCPDWLDPPWTHSGPGGPNAAGALIARVFEAFTRADPSLALGSQAILSFAAGANARNQFMTKAQILCQDRVAQHWDPLWPIPGAPGKILMTHLMGAEGRLGNYFQEQLMLRLSERLMSDAPLCSWMLREGIKRDRMEALFGRGATQQAQAPRAPAIGERLLAHWERNGVALGHAGPFGPDFLWLATRALQPFDPEPPINPKKIMNQDGSGTLSERETLFAFFARMLDHGCQFHAPGPDGTSALQAMAPLRGYGHWVALAEARVLGHQIPAAPQEEPGAAPRL